MSVKDKRNEAIFISGLPENYAAVVARLRGGDSSNGGRLRLAKGETASSILAVSAALAESPTIDPQGFEIGQVVDGKGVYQGLWMPKDGSFKSLGKTFDIYAAPEDIKGSDGNNLLMRFNDAVYNVSRLENWHEHDGGFFEGENAVLRAARDNPESLLNWFIPTKEILDNLLYFNRKKMPLGGEYVARSDSHLSNWYWSCTEGEDRKIYNYNFNEGVFACDDGDDYRLSTRPVRAELRLE